MGVLTDLIIQQTDLILRLARHINNPDKLSPTAWGVAGMDLLAEVKDKYPEDYKSEVLKTTPKKAKLRPVAKHPFFQKKESAYTHSKERQAKEYTKEGEYVNDKKPWTPDQLDDLLTEFLNGCPMLASDGRISLVYKMGRPVKAIQKAIWRLGVRDPKRSRFADYTAGQKRPDSTHLVFTERDHYLIYLATSETGLSNVFGKNKIGMMSHLAHILNREDGLRHEMIRLYYLATRKPTLKETPPFNWNNKNHFQKIHQFLKKTLGQVHTEFSDDGHE